MGSGDGTDHQAWQQASLAFLSLFPLLCLFFSVVEAEPRDKRSRTELYVSPLLSVLFNFETESHYVVQVGLELDMYPTQAVLELAP